MKKIISCILVLVMAFSIGCISVSGAATGKLSVASVSGQPGETVNVAIKMDTNPGIVGLKISVQYDSALTLTNVANGTVFPADGMTPGGDLTMNPFNVLWCKPTETKNYTGTGTLVTLTFKIANNASAGKKGIALSYDAESTFNKDLTLVPFSMTSGNVTVVKPDPPVTPSISVSQSTVSVKVGESATITYATTPANQAVSLRIGTLSYCSVQMKGSGITITGTKPGTDTFKLVMTVNGVEYTKTITVKVDPMPVADDEENEPETDPNACKYCGEVHSGLFGWLTKIFHSILFAIFGAKNK